MSRRGTRARRGADPLLRQWALAARAAAPRIVLPLEGLRLVVPGAPRTKKNHGSVIVQQGRPKHIPSDPWMRWRDGAMERMRVPGMLPDRPYNVAALFYRDSDTGDAVGYYQGLADLLQEAGVVSDDKWLVSWDGSRLRKDAAQPRVELVIAPTWEPGPAAQGGR